MQFQHALRAAGIAIGMLAGSAHAAVVAPIELDPGATLSSLPNGYSSGDAVPETKPYDDSKTYTFSDGLSLTLRARVIDYKDRPSANHPGLYFDYEIQVLAGNLNGFSVEGWSNTETFVKVCGIAGCGGSGANGVAPSSVSRSPDGNALTWEFVQLSAGEHSANLQVFSSATAFVDPLAHFTDESGNTFSVETVAPLISTVPLPASAPMFGSALLALASLGYVTTRKTNAV